MQFTIKKKVPPTLPLPLKGGRGFSLLYFLQLPTCLRKVSELIQLADMVASVMARPYNSPSKKEIANWTDAIKGKIDKKGDFLS